MGMLGAMVGAGKGLQDFATLMNEKSKMDWMAQQEAVKHERALSLENLRMQNNMVVAEKQNTWANERQGQQNTFAASENALNREATRENTMAPYSEDALSAKERAARTEAKIRGDEEIRVLGAKNAAALSQAESVYRLTSKLDMEKRKEYAEQLKATEQYQGASPEAQKQMELAALQPEVAKFMAELQKSGQREIPFEQQRLALKDGRDFFQTLPEDQRKNYKAQLTKETGKSYTDLQAAEEYAQDQLGYLINLNSSRKGQAPSSQQQPQGSTLLRLTNTSALDKMASDISSGNQDALKDLNRLVPEQQSIVLEKVKGSKGSAQEQPRTGVMLGVPGEVDYGMINKAQIGTPARLPFVDTYRQNQRVVQQSR